MKKYQIKEPLPFRINLWPFFLPAIGGFLRLTWRFRTLAPSLDLSLPQQKNRNNHRKPKFKFQYPFTYLLLVLPIVVLDRHLKSQKPETSCATVALPWLQNHWASLPGPLYLWTWLLDFLLVCSWLNFWTNPWLLWLPYTVMDERHQHPKLLPPPCGIPLQWGPSLVLLERETIGRMNS